MSAFESYPTRHKPLDVLTRQTGGGQLEARRASTRALFLPWVKLKPGPEPEETAFVLCCAVVPYPPPPQEAPGQGFLLTTNTSHRFLGASPSPGFAGPMALLPVSAGGGGCQGATFFPFFPGRARAGEA
jgi:hypothetical protein